MNTDTVFPAYGDITISNKYNQYIFIIFTLLFVTDTIFI